LINDPSKLSLTNPEREECHLTRCMEVGEGEEALITIMIILFICYNHKLTLFYKDNDHFPLIIFINTIITLS